MSDLTYREAADFLNVSPATIKNWTRQGLLPSESDINIPRKALLSFKRQMAKGKTNRLTRRANKSSAHGTFIPGEYVSDSISRKRISRLAEKLHTLECPPEQILLSYFILKTQNRKSQNSKRIKTELENWKIETGSPDLNEILQFLDGIDIPEQKDTAGLIYQMLQKEGRKSSKGSYYTPFGLAEEIIGSYEGRWESFLDPCCGSGVFLLAAAMQSGDPSSVRGWDNDSTAVHIARLNLMLQFPEQEFEPGVRVKNPLLEPSEMKFDFIATNPPWGHHFSRKQREKLHHSFPRIKSGESFSYFIEMGLSHLKDDGVLSYLLPEALLKVKTHRDIRQLISDGCSIKRVKYLDKLFRNVQTEVVRLDLEKKKEDSNAVVIRENRIYKVNTSLFIENPDLIYDFNCSERDHRIIDQVFSRNYKTLEGRAKWILGVVSGNNNRFISTDKSDNSHPIISGRDISAFQLNTPGQFIHFNREILQQSAPLEMYRLSPKIVYRFITGKPVFAVDRRGLITLNSANSLFVENDLDPEIVTGLFNSALYRFILLKKFNSLKVLRSHLEYLPIPLLNREESAELRDIVLFGEKMTVPDKPALLQSLNQMVFNFFEIEHSDREYILELLQ